MKTNLSLKIRNYILRFCLLGKYKHDVKTWEEMTVFEQWQYARDKFQHYAIRYIYDSGDRFRRSVSSDEKQYCANMANIWENIIKELRIKIITQSNIKT